VASSWVGLMVFGSLDAEDCPSKNGIKSVPLLG
jgi:hypothetical protein